MNGIEEGWSHGSSCSLHFRATRILNAFIAGWVWQTWVNLTPGLSQPGSSKERC